MGNRLFGAPANDTETLVARTGTGQEHWRSILERTEGSHLDLFALRQRKQADCQQLELFATEEDDDAPAILEAQDAEWVARNPAFTRSRIMARSNSAKTPIIWNIALPAGDVVSMPC